MSRIAEIDDQSDRRCRASEDAEFEGANRCAEPKMTADPCGVASCFQGINTRPESRNAIVARNMIERAREACRATERTRSQTAPVSQTALPQVTAPSAASIAFDPTSPVASRTPDLASSSATTDTSTPSRSATASSSQWSHNGSRLALKAYNASREFYYENPRPGLVAVGVSRGTLLFRGKKIGESYEGTAYIFNQSCGPQAYDVSGPISNGQRRITLFGQAPLLDRQCKVIGRRADILVFDFEGP